MNKKNIHFWKEKQFAFGIRWDDCFHKYEISIYFACYTLEFSFGEETT